jgi:hypothetical protein
VLTATFAERQSGASIDPDEALSMRLRDLALVDLDALTSGKQALIATFADDVAHALGEARARIAALRAQLGGPEPLNVLDLTSRQRASDTAAAGAARGSDRLTAQAEVARALARLSDLAASLIPKLFEADRRR